MDQLEQTPSLEQQNIPKNTSKNKKLLFGVSAIGLVFCILGVYSLVFKPSKTPTNKTSQASINDTEKAQKNTAEPSTSVSPKDVYYFYREKQDGAFSLYKRPISGGDRVLVSELTADYPRLLYSNNQGILYSSSNQLMYMRYGSQPKKIIEVSNKTDSPSEIIAARFYSGNTKVLYSVTSDYSGTNASLRSVSIDGTNEQVLFTPTKTTGALLLDGWDGDKTAYVRYSCWNCDGSPSPTLSYKIDLGTGKQVDNGPLEDLPAESTESVTYTTDLKKAFYFTATIDNSIAGDAYSGIGGVGSYLGAPYTFFIRDNDSKKDTSLKSSLGNKDTMVNDTRFFYYRSIDFDTTNQPYMVFGSDLYSINDEKVSLLYQVDSPQQIYKVAYLDTSIAVVALHNPVAGTNDTPVYVLDLATKKATKIMTATIDGTVFAGISRE